MPEGVSRMPTCRCIKFHVASSPILEENESEHWLAKKEDNSSKRERDYKRKEWKGKKRRGNRKVKGRIAEQMEWRRRGRRETPRRDHARGSRVKKLRNGDRVWNVSPRIERVAALRAAATFLHNPRIRSNGISLRRWRDGAEWRGKPPRLLQPESSPRLVTPCRARPKISRPPSPTRIFHTVSTHNRFRDYSPRETSNFRRRILQKLYIGILWKRWEACAFSFDFNFYFNF